MATAIRAPRPIIGRPADPFAIPGAAFIGTGRALYGAEWDQIAAEENCTPAFLRAVAYQESRGAGFDRWRRVSCEFVPWVFGPQTGNRWDGIGRHAHVTARRYAPSLLGLPPHGPYRQFDHAVELDREAALKACGCGLMRLHLFHAAELGFADPGEMLERMKLGEREQVELWLRWAGNNGALAAARAQDIPAFARIQNGAGYRLNRYDERLLALVNAYAGGVDQWVAKVLRSGSAGPAVTYLQERLALHIAPREIVVDGYFGEATRAAVLDVQREADLPVDGVVGRRTWEVLRAAPRDPVGDLVGELPRVGERDARPRDLAPVEPLPADVRERPGALARVSDWVSRLFVAGGSLELVAQLWGKSVAMLPAVYWLAVAAFMIAAGVYWLFRRPS